ncbi:hypothetical protein B0H11DRAFT_2221540 [Mycena galericulata]|nr:hypothetical protein B0H11DRAFT_2221540 [Mycena galericulata]
MAPFLPSAPTIYQNVLDFRHHFMHARQMAPAPQNPIQAMHMTTGFLGSHDLDIAPDTDGAGSVAFSDAFEEIDGTTNCGSDIYSASSPGSTIQPEKMWLEAHEGDCPEHILTAMRVELGHIGLLVADSPAATYHQVCQTIASLGRKIDTLESVWKKR